MLVLGLAVGGYVALVGIVYLSQRRLIYPRPRTVLQPRARDASLEQASVPGAPAAIGLYFAAAGTGRTILHFHGNGEQVGDLIGLGQAIRARGLGFYAMEYPGYGSAEGEPSEQANYAAAEATIVHLATRHGVSKEALVLQGQSLGTGIALEMAHRGHGSLLVLLSPYTSMVDMGKLALPIFPSTLLLLDRYLNLSKAPAVPLPALVIHGTQDEVIPVSMGERVAQALPNARLRLIEGGHHNDLFVVSGRQVLDEIERFCGPER